MLYLLTALPLSKKRMKSKKFISDIYDVEGRHDEGSSLIHIYRYYQMRY